MKITEELLLKPVTKDAANKKNRLPAVGKTTRTVMVNAGILPAIAHHSRV
ncbi:hypothetical protein OGH69_08045 [Flavobacterium sp. MFBS3-15]|nr:hypothetical protein [Flavobacterium sp. MFBS3-15]MCW4468910.1 hypothetical protein [Flavobacterium sp. MFBS3-15]